MPLAVPQPITWTAGQAPQAADFNTNIRDAFNFTSSKTVFAARQTAAQSIPNNATAVLTLDTVIEDTYSGWTSGAGNKYTAQADGLYLVTCRYCSTGGNGAGAVAAAFIRLNGTDAAEGEQHAIASMTNWATCVAWLVSLRSGTDFVQPAAFQTSGAALNTVASSLGNSSHMEVQWISVN
jgi:hypothetical protein